MSTCSALRMTGLGHSLPIGLVSASRDVRCSPKADIRFHCDICRFGPKADILRCDRNYRYSITSSGGEQ